MSNQNKRSAFQQSHSLKHILTLMGMCFFIPNLAVAEGPFGVDIGSDPALLESCAPYAKEGIYKCDSLPKTHSAFETYIIQASSRQGVCFIKAVSFTKTNDSTGAQVTVLSNDLAEQLEQTYGPKSSTEDFLIEGSIWNEVNDWMAAISRYERMYSHRWVAEQGYKVKNRVIGLSTYVQAINSSSGYVSVEFRGDNYEDCKKELSFIEASAF